MTKQEFDNTEFSAKSKVIYLDKILPVLAVDFEDRTIGLILGKGYNLAWFPSKDCVLLNPEIKINVQGSASLRIHDVRECNASIDKSNASDTKSLDSELLEKRTDDEKFCELYQFSRQDKPCESQCDDCKWFEEAKLKSS